MNLHLTAFRSAKDTLKTGNFVVTLDFSENFAFVVQEAVQGFHWNNNQATVHPFFIYYKNNKTTLERGDMTNLGLCKIVIFIY